MAFKEFVIGFFILGLFAFALLSFGYQIQVENNVNSTKTLLQNDAVAEAYGNLSSKLQSIDQESNDSLTSVLNDEPTVGVDSILLFAIVGAGKTFLSVAAGLWNITFGLIEDTLNIEGSGIVAAVFVAIMLVTSIVVIWKFVRNAE